MLGAIEFGAGMKTATPFRLTLLIPGGLALLAGLDSALLLLGLPAPLTTNRLADIHGPLMVFAFLGTLIALERAVAHGAWWAYLAPAALGAGGLAALSPFPLLVAQGLIMVGFGLQVAIYRSVWRRQQQIYLAIQTLGAASALGGALLWLAGVPVPQLVPWMAAYLILTIAGERVELSRLARTSQRPEQHAFWIALVIFAAPALALISAQWGQIVLGLGLLGLVAWLWTHDIARGTIRSRGLPRFSAACLLAGYGWLAGAAALWILRAPILEGRIYDATLHSVFLGFVMSMIFAHAAIILPAVIRKPLPYRAVLWVPAALLHASLILRVLVGDARDIAWAVSWGGALNIAAVLLFIGCAVFSSATASRAKPGGIPSAASSGGTPPAGTPPAGTLPGAIPLAKESK